MAPKKASTPTKAVPKKAADVGTYLERQPGQTMKPKPIIAGYYGVRGERLRYTVHEGALRLPSAALGIIRSQLELIQSSGQKDITAMSSYKLPHVDAVALRPSVDPKLLAEGVVLTKLSTQIHTPPPRMDPATGTMLHFQPTTRTAAENQKICNPTTASGIEPERIRGGGDDSLENMQNMSSAQSQQARAATSQAPGPAQQAPCPNVAPTPSQQSTTPAPPTATPMPRAAPTPAAPISGASSAPVAHTLTQNLAAVPQPQPAVTAPPAVRPAVPATQPVAVPRSMTQTPAGLPTSLAQAPVHQSQTQGKTVLQPARPEPFSQVAPTPASLPVRQAPSTTVHPPRPAQRTAAPIARTGGIRNPLSAPLAQAPKTQQQTTTLVSSTYPRAQVGAPPRTTQASSFIAPAPTQAPRTTTVPGPVPPHQQRQTQRPVVNLATTAAPRPDQQQHTSHMAVAARVTSSPASSVAPLSAAAAQSSQAVAAAIARQQAVPSAGQAAASAVSRPVAVAPAPATVSASAPVARAAPSAPIATAAARPPATVSSGAPVAVATVPSSRPPAAGPVPAPATSSASVPKEASKPTPPAPELVPLNKTPPSQYEQLAPAANDEMQVEITVDRPDWFDKDKASDLEMTLLPEWFNQSAPHRTHKSYIKTRNAILTISSKLGNRYVTKTLMRRTVPGDVGSMHRLHDFLVAYSLINADAINDSTPTHPKLREIRFAWTLPLRDLLTETVVQVAQPSADGVQVDWEQVAGQVGCGVTPIDCEREFLSLTTLSTAKSTNEPVERSITPDAMEVDGPDSGGKRHAADGMVAWLQDIARRADPQVVEAATSKALEVSSTLEQAQKSAQAALVVSAATQSARSEEESLSRSLAELHEQRLLKLENRMAMLDDVECLLETERAALELERRDLYTARCRHWFGGGAS